MFGLKDKSILEKYDIAISLLKGQEIKRGFYPYQDVSYLIHIRNELIHYKPEWDNKPEISVEIMKKYNKGFKLSPFVDKNTPFFLLKCLGHGCAEWAVKTTIDFVNSFYTQMALPLPFDLLSIRMETKH